MIDFQKLFSNQYCKDGTLKARNSIYSYMLKLKSGNTYYEFEGDYYHGHYKSFYNYHFGKFQQFLNKLGIKYRIDNDAPRGGRAGNHIVIVDNKKAEQIYNDFMEQDRKQTKDIIDSLKCD
jgi:hypothetical protein